MTGNLHVFLQLFNPTRNAISDCRPLSSRWCDDRIRVDMELSAWTTRRSAWTKSALGQVERKVKCPPLPFCTR
ncbi:hypothetical protein CEXT_730771 [Caerostris extrusa]|uniref:Uncharacterized protein n=1 Tax=Caerostris extrusa TaxID=172846 RepID=A0AAV4UKE9_CAEEX|nr:hypothetical protein CEXT_730771 [Caerostris extrusa]